MPNLSLDRYPQDMRALAPLVTDAKPGGRRVQRTSSTATADVTVIGSPEASVTMIVQESGLYVKGFRNQHGSFYFNGANGGSNELKFGCSYVGSYSLGIFNDDLTEAKKLRSKKDLVAAVTALAGFQGGANANDLHLKVPLTLMVFAISEAIRFTIVYDRIVEACKGAGGTFSFYELRNYVQNWSALSAGEAVSGAQANTVFTSHS